MKLLKTMYLCVINGILSPKTATSSQAQITDPEQMDTTQSTISKMDQDIEYMKRIKVSGFIQTQFQIADSSGIPSFSDGDFPQFTNKRFMVRLSRLNATWNNIHSTFVLQADATEAGTVSLKDAYLKFTDSYLEMFSITVGVFIRPFGYEITSSSSNRESPERGKMSQILLPGERDMGFMLTVQAPKTSRWNILKLDAGFYNGTSLGAKEFDKKKDFISRVSIIKASANEKVKIGFRVSFYDGGFRLDNNTTYSIASINDTTKFTIEKKTRGDYSNRQYYGADAQFSIDWVLGITTIRAEYIMGEQPATATDSKSPSASLLGPDGKTGVGTYVCNRSFNGAYFYFLQNIGQTKAQFVLKYDWYDPNTDIEGEEIGVAGTKTSSADIKFSTLGLGGIWRFDQNFKAMVYYDMVKNEKTKLEGYSEDINDNVLTLRLQYRY